MKSEDKRVKLTKLAIRENFFELMKEYPISKISVKLICEKSDINRSTFYSHYEDQYDLLRKIENEAMAEIKEYIKNKNFNGKSEVTVPIMTQILEFVRDKKVLFNVLLGENGDTSFKRNIMLIAQENMIKEITLNNKIDKKISGYLQIFAINGTLGIIQKWLDDKNPDPPYKIAELINNLLFKGLTEFYINN